MITPPTIVLIPTASERISQTQTGASTTSTILKTARSEATTTRLPIVYANIPPANKIAPVPIATNASIGSIARFEPELIIIKLENAKAKTPPKTTAGTMSLSFHHLRVIVNPAKPIADTRPEKFPSI
jgi:hypothetical protein